MVHTKPRVLCFGEVSWDYLSLLNEFPRKERDCHMILEREGAGGCALNTAVVLHGFARSHGVGISLGGNALGEDDAGRKIRAYVDGIELPHALIQKPGLRTPTCQVLVEQETAERGFILSHEDVQKYEEDLIQNLVRQVRSGGYSHAFIDPYLKRASLELLSRIRDVPGLWILIQDVKADSPFVPLANAVQISIPSDQPFTQDAVRALCLPYFRERLQTVFATSGSRGVAVCERGRDPLLIPALEHPVHAVDTTGCGDAFRAGLIWGLYRGLPLHEAVALGQRSGRHKAGLYGSHFLDTEGNLK